MDTSPHRGLHRSELSVRYGTPISTEDPWHSYSGVQTAKILSHYLRPAETERAWLLNAGAGVYEVAPTEWREISLDLFEAPIRGRPYAVCGSIEHLPFADSVFAGVVCVGEVLGYCDPAKAIAELARTTRAGATLICDFRNSGGFRQWFSGSCGRASYRRILVTEGIRRQRLELAI
jgi:SAM-dependent methyltransferase